MPASVVPQLVQHGGVGAVVFWFKGVGMRGGGGGDGGGGGGERVTPPPSD